MGAASTKRFLSTYVSSVCRFCEQDRLCTRTMLVLVAVRCKDPLARGAWLLSLVGEHVELCGAVDGCEGGALEVGVDRGGRDGRARAGAARVEQQRGERVRVAQRLGDVGRLRLESKSLRGDVKGRGRI
eukprot:6211422-Pleurochrysis_carterae.AAC.3